MQIMKNLFLSGDINVGKSTIIEKLIYESHISKDKIGGFYTKAYLENDKVMGFYIEPINFNSKIPTIQNRLIGYTPDGNSWVAVEKTFETFGVQILNYCLNSKFKLIIMDELGFFENKANNFQKIIHKVLSSDKKVLGCIKPFSTSFMDSIRQRKDVIEVDITRSNRNDISRILAEKF